MTSPRLAMLTPLPPAQSGVAHYVSLILAALQARFDLNVFDSLAGYDPAQYDLSIYQLGNNPHHELAFRQALSSPGIAVLHDIVLHHLIVEMTLARGDGKEYIAALERSHGLVGRAWAEARSRAGDLHDELANFLLPASMEVAARSLCVIVHNQYARNRLMELGVTTPIVVVNHPFVPRQLAPRELVRKRLGIPRNARVAGLFGFLTSAKRSHIVLEAFRLAREQDPSLLLLVVGQPAPNINVDDLKGGGIIYTGYLADDEFDDCYAAIDRLVNLRYPSAGESSGTLIRAFDAGVPTAVSDYAQFTEFPPACAVRIPLGLEELGALVRFLLEPIDLVATASAQRKWLEEHATAALTVDGYAKAIAIALSGQPAECRFSTLRQSPLTLFPVLSADLGSAPRSITLTNDGRATIRTRTYGQPGYRLIVKVFKGQLELFERWVELPGDLEPGQSTTIALPDCPDGELALYHALEGLPMLEPEAWFRASL